MDIRLKAILFFIFTSISLSPLAEQKDIHIHLASVHWGNTDENINNFNWGIGYNLTDQTRIGAYYNSSRKPSVYALGFLPLTNNIRIGLGAITGYEFHDQHPNMIPAITLEADLTDHTSVIFFGNAIHLQLNF